jgi:hypothetical protein
MSYEKMSKLGAILFGDKVDDLKSAMNRLDKLIRLPDRYREMPKAFGGALVFDQGAKLKLDEPSPLNDKSGFQSEAIHSLFTHALLG